jgi:hypothetical protein
MIISWLSVLPARSFRKECGETSTLDDFSWREFQYTEHNSGAATLMNVDSIMDKSKLLRLEGAHWYHVKVNLLLPLVSSDDTGNVEVSVASPHISCDPAKLTTRYVRTLHKQKSSCGWLIALLEWTRSEVLSPYISSREEVNKQGQNIPQWRKVTHAGYLSPKDANTTR